MNLDQVKSFIKMAKEEGVFEIKYETKDAKLEFKFGSATVVSQPVMQVPVTQAANKVETKATNASKASDYHEIKSPFVGTFYSSSAPTSPVFVKVGDKVKKGQTLCILEAMKIMNEIESDINGEIVEICLENESLVEYGQVLFKIKA
jgi:acetyl-CoA carboxylase biotin carboxyl carrier protein